jgi:hypothetical protein
VLHFLDEFLKRRTRSLIMLGQIDSRFPQAGKVGLLKILWRVRDQDLKCQIFRQGSDQLDFGVMLDLTFRCNSLPAPFNSGQFSLGQTGWALAQNRPYLLDPATRA